MIDGFRMMIGFFLSFFAGGSPGGGGKREGEFASPMEKIDIYPFFFGGGGGFLCCPASPPSYYTYIQKGATNKIQYIYTPPPRASPSNDPSCNTLNLYYSVVNLQSRPKPFCPSHWDNDNKYYNVIFSDI